MAGSGSGEDPGEASELQPDSTGGSQSGTLSSANSSASTCVRLSVPLEAEQIHAKMKRYWREFSNTAYNKDVLKQLSHVLFMKRKEVRSDGAGELDHAFASEQETFLAIRGVLERRWIYLQRKGIKNPGHILDEDQRAEFCKEVRKEYENGEDQQTRQANDKEQWVGGNASKAGRGKRRFVKNQKRKRWHRHLQRICGTKQVWEILSFTGCFEPALIQAAVMNDKVVLEEWARCFSACARVLLAPAEAA